MGLRTTLILTIGFVCGTLFAILSFLINMYVGTNINEILVFVVAFIAGAAAAYDELPTPAELEEIVEEFKKQ